MKIKKQVKLLVCMLFAGLMLGITAFADQAYLFGSTQNGVKIHNGVADTSYADVTDGVIWLGKTATRISIKENSIENPVEIRHTDIENLEISLSGTRYIVYEYIYNGTKTNLRPTLTLHKKDFSVPYDNTAYAMEVLKSGEWNYAVFDIGDYMGDYLFTNATLPKMTFNPYGDVPANELSENDTLYIHQIMLWSKQTADTNANNGKFEYKYPIYFTSGRADTQGETPETLYVKVGDSVKMPENPYNLEGYNFNGWVCSDGSTVYIPGQEVTIIEKSIKGSNVESTGRTYFIANWVPNVPDIRTTKFYNYNNGANGIMDAKYGQYIEDYEKACVFDGIIASKYSIMEKDSECYKTWEALDLTDTGKNKNQIAIFDGWTWDKLPLDIKEYKHCAVLYYWDTDKQINCRPNFNFLIGTTGALTEPSGVRGKEQLKKNQWALMEFSFDFENDPNLSKNTNFKKSTIANQVHFYPFGSTNILELLGDTIYIADIVFFTEKPSSVNFSNGFIEGNGDGTFKPNQELTRAQAASIAAKALGYSEDTVSNAVTTYTDIENDAWYYGCVAFLENKGVLNPEKDNGLFCGDSTCTEYDYLVLLTNASAKLTGAKDVGTLPDGTLTGRTLTRAEATVLASNVLRGMSITQKDIEFSINSEFADVSLDSWYGADVAVAANDVLLYKKSDGSSSVCSMPAIDTDAELNEVPVISEKKYLETDAYISQLDTLTNNRIAEIRNTQSQYKVKDGGTVYYVSSSYGSESSDGKSENNPRLVSALADVSALPVKPGDVVLFCRGDTFTGTLQTSEGVTYSAYGSGNKPLFVNTPSDAGQASSWSLVYQNNETGSKIWKYHNEKIIDVGGINLIDSNGNITVAYKEIPDYNKTDKQFYVRNSPTVVYDYKVELDSDLMFFHDGRYNSNGTETDASPTACGPLYLRCDKGNPATLYSDITLNVYGNVIMGVSNVTIDNICIKYFGSHGIAAGTVHNLTVTNCEIGWGGGAILKYDNGSVTRYGNGIEIYGGLTNYTIDNCYVYEIYDAGITHQISDFTDGNCQMDGVYYRNNVLLNSTYNIEYFMMMNSSEDSNGNTIVRERMIKDVYFTGNITRTAGYGWGVQRPDSSPANIKGWTYFHNLCTNYVIENNVFDRCLNLNSSGTDYLIEAGSTYYNSTPYLKNNIFVQAPGRMLMLYGKNKYYTNIDSENILNTMCGEGNKLYFHREDKELYKDNIFWNN